MDNCTLTSNQGVILVSSIESSYSCFSGFSFINPSCVKYQTSNSLDRKVHNQGKYGTGGGHLGRSDYDDPFLGTPVSSVKTEKPSSCGDTYQGIKTHRRPTSRGD